MKKIFQFMTLFVAALFMACGSTTTDTGSTGTSTPNNTTVNNAPTPTTTPTVGEKSNGNRNVSVYNTNPNKEETVNQVDYDMQRTVQMYTSLNMTEDQIQRYETATRSSMDAWKLSNAERAMTEQQRMEQQSTTIRAILDDTQYQTYQQWVRDNPIRN